MAECYLYNKCSHISCDKDFCIRKFKLDELYKAAQVSDIQKKKIALRVDDDGTDLAEFKQLAEHEKHIKEFVENGTNLYLHSGQAGNGKTTWSLRLLQAYFDVIWAKTTLKCHGLFISVPSFLVGLKKNITGTDLYSQYISDNVLDAELVIWDDIGTKMGSEYEIDQLFNIINRRIQLGKANIFTSNLSDLELAEALGARLASRIANGSINIELHGKDKRFLQVSGGDK